MGFEIIRGLGEEVIREKRATTSVVARFSRRTGRASHLLGPPLCFCHSNSTVEELCLPTSLWKGEGGCGGRHPRLLMV